MNWLVPGAIAAGALIAWTAYEAGWQGAVKASPEYEALKKQERLADEEFWRELESQVTDREKVCDRIFEDVETVLRGEHFDDQNEMNQMREY